MNNIPLPLFTDSYKVTHFLQYPNIQKLSVFGTFRTAFLKDLDDKRLVFYGIRYMLEQYICRQWTEQDLEKAESFFLTHKAGFRPFPWPKELFTKIVREYNGYFPVKIEALPEGSVVYPNTPVIVISAEGEFAKLASYLETILCMIWYPCTVATLSRRCRDTIESYFDATVSPENMNLLESRLHDFGFRGCASIEQAMIGGSAHLLNFEGTDTLVAAYYSQYDCNEGRPIGTSIPASEHSVMTCFENERDALLHIIDVFGDDIFACVMDSYDYAAALDSILPSIAAVKVKKGGFMVLRPDSGDPTTVVLQALRAAEKVFGSSINAKGYKVLNGVSVIQGDGISHNQIEAILSAMSQEGYSAQNIAFGMGSALLQRVHRDFASFAMKASYAEYDAKHARDLIKFPKGDSEKLSLPGEFVLHREAPDSPLTVYPKESEKGKEILNKDQNCLEVVYDCGPVTTRIWDSFDEIRSRMRHQWTSFPKKFNPASPELLDKISKCRIEQETRNLDAYNL